VQPPRKPTVIATDTKTVTQHVRRCPARGSTERARPRFLHSLSALIFGAWNSTGEGGGLGAKFPRAIVSEIVGVGVATEPAAENEPPVPSGKRTGSRIDPLGIRSAVKVYKQPNGDWDLKKSGAKGEKEGRPSEVNHSNIAPSVDQLGVSIDYAQHTFVLSFSALRRLGFAGATEEQALAARTALAALGLLAQAAYAKTGYFLRSRCELVPEEGSSSALQLIKPDGTREETELSLGAAVELFTQAVEAADGSGMKWQPKDLVLKPQSKLVELVRQSRAKALEGEEEDAT